ncbi:hypothetical protein CMI37_00355 [Candidatus Pacearchaeota archaeon]|nr:hypothetical protein [Candidatus Pacearchaeota archaeon]|tara:strand:- start:906 stop:1286 length:381 start_codon:yes stop_codon:yes gene_type:complete
MAMSSRKKPVPKKHWKKRTQKLRNRCRLKDGRSKRAVPFHEALEFCRQARIETLFSTMSLYYCNIHKNYHTGKNRYGYDRVTKLLDTFTRQMAAQGVIYNPIDPNGMTIIECMAYIETLGQWEDGP